MNHFLRPLAIVTLGLAAGAASAQYVKGNEAVRVTADGSRKVETPPTAGALLAKPCAAANPGCSGAGWKMVETPGGLMECTEVYARPSTCRASTYGAEKRSRVWVVKVGSEWKQCQYPDLSSLSGILCARHSMTTRSMYAEQEDDEGGGGRSGEVAAHSERTD